MGRRRGSAPLPTLVADQRVPRGDRPTHPASTGVGLPPLEGHHGNHSLDEVKRGPLFWLGVALLAVGLLGHLLAADGTGGRPVDYQHHVLGFVIIAAVTGPIAWVLGRFFWRHRQDITVLVIGALQAVFGLLVYAQRFYVASNF
jgi:hypothetical protein